MRVLWKSVVRDRSTVQVVFFFSFSLPQWIKYLIVLKPIKQFSFFSSLLTFNEKNNSTLNQENYVNKIITNPDKADPPRLFLLLAD